MRVRRWREPLSDAERLLGARYYDLDQRRAILHSVKLKPDVDADKLIDRIEWWVDHSLSALVGQAHDRRTADQTRREFCSLAARGRKYHADMEIVQPDPACHRRLVRGRAALEMKLKRIRHDINLRNDLLGAAERVADREWKLPDLSFERDGTGIIIWPLEEQIDLALASIAGVAWLTRVAAEAIAYIELRLAPASNRGDEIAEALERALVKIYTVEAAKPRDPVYDDARGHHVGELLDFLCACLRPIGDRRSPEALYKALCRASPNQRKPQSQLWGRHSNSR